VPPKTYDEMFLTFLKDFTLQALDSFFERLPAQMEKIGKAYDFDWIELQIAQ